MVFHAGSKFVGDRVLTKGGRVLTVAARGGSMQEAVKKAYQGIARISFDGMHYRRDIGGGI